VVAVEELKLGNSVYSLDVNLRVFFNRLN